MINTYSFHKPVLLSLVIEALKVEPGKKYIDATIGGGGYAFEIVKRGGIVLGIDQDRDAIKYIKKILRDKDIKILSEKFDKSLNILVSQYPNITLVQGNFANLKSITSKYGFEKVAGIIFDLGISSHQLEKSDRGFSYEGDEPLDMRMDKNIRFDAGALLNNYSEDRLYEIFSIYAEELHSRAIAKAIVRARSLKKELKGTGELSDIIKDVLNRIYLSKTTDTYRIFQKTKARIFQAIRIEVNNEMENLEGGLTEGIDLLDNTGRIVVLSYHSLEDRKVKMIFRRMQSMNILAILNIPLKAQFEEIKSNSKARSAKIRAAQKIS